MNVRGLRLTECEPSMRGCAGTVPAVWSNMVALSSVNLASNNLTGVQHAEPRHMQDCVAPCVHTPVFDKAWRLRF